MVVGNVIRQIMVVLGNPEDIIVGRANKALRQIKQRNGGR